MASAPLSERSPWLCLKSQQVSRKAFSSDLDTVFSPGAQHEPNIDRSPWLLRTGATASPANPTSTRTPATRRPGKSFASDLDAFFAESTAERARDPARAEGAPTDELNTRLRERPRRALQPLGGLDSLIRDTTGGRAPEQQARREAEEQAPAAPKRVTFTYDRDRFALLKQIAREEGSYLKDIISGLLNDYIAKQTRSNSRTA